MIYHNIIVLLYSVLFYCITNMNISAAGRSGRWRRPASTAAPSLRSASASGGSATPEARLS